MKKKQAVRTAHPSSENGILRGGARAVFVFWLCAAVIAAHAQEAKQALEQVRSGEPLKTQVFQKQVIREIDDPHTGDRWLLLRDGGHGGPGRMVWAGRANHRATEARGPAMNLPVIRAGAHVIVEEDSPTVRARLQAIALGNAAIGAHLNVRLEIGGSVVRVIAVDGGRVALTDGKESWR